MTCDTGLAAVVSAVLGACAAVGVCAGPAGRGRRGEEKASGGGGRLLGVEGEPDADDMFDACCVAFGRSRKLLRLRADGCRWAVGEGD